MSSIKLVLISPIECECASEDEGVRVQGECEENEEVRRSAYECEDNEGGWCV